MKPNLKDFPKFNADPTTNEQQAIAWKEAFEKEIRDDKEWYEECLKTCSECATTRPICEDRVHQFKKILGES